jgi:hypothetical protein
MKFLRKLLKFRLCCFGIHNWESIKDYPDGGKIHRSIKARQCTRCGQNEWSLAIKTQWCVGLPVKPMPQKPPGNKVRNMPVERESIKPNRLGLQDRETGLP